MKNNRREFLKVTGIAGITLAGTSLVSPLSSRAGESASKKKYPIDSNDNNTSIIGQYGPWLAELKKKELPELSFRRKEWTNIESWKIIAKKRLRDRLSIPDLGVKPEVTIDNQYSYDGLHIEEISWQLPFGRRTQAILLKPINAKGPLPGILALHDHGADKFNGKDKIVKTSDKREPIIEAHQKEYYAGRGWANEIAKRGYVVLVSDAFTFASRRVKLEDVPPHIRKGLELDDSSKPESIVNYNKWAAQHEHIMAKSLFSAGTTWPGMFLAEDIMALNILCDRNDVNEHKIGCAGLSGGGIRTLFLSAVDARIKCSVPIGFMTTTSDLILQKSFTHTWMTFAPHLANDLDFAEIVSLHAPMPILVLNNIDDALFSYSEMQNADKMLREVYNKAQVENNYRCSFHPGIHKFDIKMQEEAFDWFDQWLKA